MLLAGAALAVAAVPRTPPDQLVSSTVASLVRLVADCRLQLATDPRALRGIVDVHLRPRLDVLHAGQFILGRWWRDATPEQRRRFSEALYGSLADRYSPALLLLTGDTVRVPAAGELPGEGDATVRILVRRPGAEAIPVDLKMRASGEAWRVYDARWEGLSFVLQLREAVGEEVRREGLDAVIRRLESAAGEHAGDPAGRDSLAGRCLRQQDSPA